MNDSTPVIDYRLASGLDEESLVHRVRMMLREGFVPVGGPACHDDGLIQAMVKPALPDRPDEDEAEREAARKSSKLRAAGRKVMAARRRKAKEGSGNNELS